MIKLIDWKTEELVMNSFGHQSNQVNNRLSKLNKLDMHAE